MNIVHIEGFNLESALIKKDLLEFNLVYLIARRRLLVAVRVELLGVLPVPGVEAGGGMRRARIAVALEARVQQGVR